MSLKDRALEYYRRHEAYAPAVFFVLGFVFDIVTLGRIDDLLTIVQQGAYLALIASFISLEILERRRPLAFPANLLGRGAAKIWEYRELIVHFLFGSLLSAYTLFYFKSTSSFVSFAFLVLLVGLMLANEAERFQRLGAVMRFALFSLSLVSYLGYVVPVFLGWIGLVPFLISVTLSLILIVGLYKWLAKLLDRRLGSLLRDRPTAPVEGDANSPLDTNLPEARRLNLLSFRAAIGVQVVFLLLYVLQILPPVPLSIRYIGIYHNVEKISGGGYRLSYERPPWKFWQHGAQTFLARPGDKVFVFARIFSPTRFKDQVYVRWLYDDPRSGWKSSDAIPMQISGGREEGFRGFAFKQNYTPGDWRVQIETTDGREIGRIGFTVLPLEEDESRPLAVDID